MRVAVYLSEIRRLVAKVLHKERVGLVVDVPNVANRKLRR